MPLFAIPFPAFDPVAIEVGPLAVRWYALAYIAGIILGWVYAVRLTRNERLWSGPAPVSPQRLDDFVVWATLDRDRGRAAIYSLHCPHDPVIYFFTGYGIAIGAVTLAGAALGARFLRW